MEQKRSEDEKQLDPAIEPYLRSAIKNTEDCTKLLQFDAGWKSSATIALKYKFKDEQTVSISAKLSYISVKSKPTIWLTDWISLGDPEMIYNVWFKNRIKWDEGLAGYDFHSFDKSKNIDNNCFILHHKMKSIGNIISARDFVDIVKIDKTEKGKKMFISRSEIEHPDFKPIKGHVRGHILKCGISVQQLDDTQIKENKLPTSIESSQDLKWCRLRMIAQMDFAGWCPRSLLDSVMTPGTKMLANNSFIFTFKQYKLNATQI